MTLTIGTITEENHYRSKKQDDFFYLVVREDGTRIIHTYNGHYQINDEEMPLDRSLEVIPISFEEMSRFVETLKDETDKNQRLLNIALRRRKTNTII